MKRQLVLVFYPDANGYVGLWQPLAREQWLQQPVASGREQGALLLSAVTRLLKQSGHSVKDLTHIGVMAGPASYTQLRLFIATANSLAWALSVPVFSFTPEVQLPDSIPTLLSEAKQNVPVLPVYPTELG